MIYMHGLGESPKELLDVFDEFSLCSKECRIILPHAKTGSVGVYDRVSMPRWFDIYSKFKSNMSLD